MRRLRPTQLGALLSAATLGVAGLTTAVYLSHDGASSRPAASPPVATASPWPGQLSGPAPQGPDLAVGDVTLVRNSRALVDFTPAQVTAAYTQLRVTLARLGASPQLVDPSRQPSADDFTATSGPLLSSSGEKALTAIAPAALEDQADAAQALRPLFLWYGSADDAAATDLKLAAHPYGPFALTAAAVTELNTGEQHGLAFRLSTELTLRLVDRAGATNRLFLIRNLEAVMVENAQADDPSAADDPLWQLEAWTGSWQITKPVGQELPDATPDTKSFAPGRG